jgi:hypothetical protein
MRGLLIVVMCSTGCSMLGGTTTPERIIVPGYDENRIFVCAKSCDGGAMSVYRKGNELCQCTEPNTTEEKK